MPGNIRELQHTIEKAVILSESAVINPMNYIYAMQDRLAATAHIQS